jgi:shikimate kinase
MPGCGKSSIGFRLSKLMELPFIDTDYYIAAKEGKSILEIFAEQGEEYFRKVERQVLLEIVENASSVISSGGGMPCFFDNIDVMNDAAVTVYLETTPLKLFEHLKNDKKRPLVANKPPEELMDYINSSYTLRRACYEKADITVQAYDKTPMQLAMKICKIINSLYTIS